MPIRASRSILAGVALSASVGWAVPGHAKSLGVSCDDVLVGTISYDSLTQDGQTGMFANFEIDTEKFQTLDDVAKACDQHHFNWEQKVISATHLPVDVNGNPLKPPFLDPPLGGYGNNPATPKDDTLWADNLPWYWNEGPVPSPLPPGYKEGYHLDDHTSFTNLTFRDFPAWPDATQEIRFRTRLVSVFEDGKFHKYHGGWEWTWKSAGGGSVGSFQNLPEPSAWATMVLGFGCIGLRARRRALPHATWRSIPSQ